MSSNPKQSSWMLHKCRCCFWVKPTPHNKGAHCRTVPFYDFIKARPVRVLSCKCIDSFALMSNYPSDKNL